MDKRPIGIFDSGLGGLTGLTALHALLPGEDLIYFGDTGRMPYGGRPAAQLRRMAQQNLDFMASFDVKAIFVACGTVSSTAADLLERCPIPCFGVLRAGVDAMAQVPGLAQGRQPGQDALEVRRGVVELDGRLVLPALDEG